MCIRDRLQKDRTNPVVAQDPWFGQQLDSNNISDLVPDSWIIEKIPEEKIQ